MFFFEIQFLKINEKHLKSTHTLLKYAQVIRENNSYPGCVFMHPKDYRRLESNTRKSFKKEYPFLSSNKLQTSVAMHMLNYGPAIINLGLKEGYILVDIKRVDCEHREINAENT